jgi:trk system potassium uptake protein TrkH
MHFHTVAHVLGRLIVVYAGVLLIPMAVAIGYENVDTGGGPSGGEPFAFLVAAIVAAIVGFTLSRVFRPDFDKFAHREGFGVVTLAWVALTLLGAIPYCLVTTGPLTYVDACFETLSGLTTTGATVMTGDMIEGAGYGIHLWRSLTQWLGGVGIVVLVLAMLTSFGAGGYQLLRAEVPGPTKEKLSPKITRTAKMLWGVYLLLTALQVMALWLPTLITGAPAGRAAGGPYMDLYESVCHAFTTLSTGGFSTRAASADAFLPYHHYIFIGFMFLAGVNFLLHIQLLRGRARAWLQSSELRVYGIVVLGATVVVVFALTALPVTDHQAHGDDRFAAGHPQFQHEAGHTPSPHKYETVESTIRHSLFQVVSIVTTTGYATADFDRWPDLARLLLLGLMLLGGCAGSTAGGLKIIRVMIVFKHAIAEIRRLVYPHSVQHVRIDGTPVADRTLQAIMGTFTLYVSALMIGSIFFAALDGFDAVTAAGCAISTIGNIGPGLGRVGAVEHYGWIPDAGKIVACMLMLLGRLEIYTVLILLTPSFYRK